MAVLISNPSVEICALPYPLQGILRGGQRIILSNTLAALVALCPSLDDGALTITDLGSEYAGPNDNASFGPVSAAAPTYTINDATADNLSTAITLSHTTSGTASAGIGVRALLKTENGSGTEVLSGSIAGGLAVVTAASESGFLELRPAYAGTAHSVGFRARAEAAAGVNGVEVVPGATTVPALLAAYGETNVGLRIRAKGTGTLQLRNPADDATRMVVGATGIGFLGAAESAQLSAQTALTTTVAGDMPGPTAAEITTRLNLIENRLNAVSTVLRTFGYIAT